MSFQQAAARDHVSVVNLVVARQNVEDQKSPAMLLLDLLAQPLLINSLSTLGDFFGCE
jgi:hypothetical protein